MTLAIIAVAIMTGLFRRVLIRLVKSVVIFACCTLLLACESVPTTVNTASKALPGRVSAGIRPVESILITGQSMEVLFYLTNGTDNPITVLPWGTPLEQQMTADRFEISLSGNGIPYSGPVVKRPAPSEDHYLTLEAGEKRETVVDLSQVYDVSASGEYTVALRGFAFQSLNSDSIDPFLVEKSFSVTRQ